MLAKRSGRCFSKIMFLCLGLAVAGLELFPAHASDADIEEKVLEVLQQRHPTDGAAFWQGLGIDGPRVVRGMIPKAQSTYYRVRLIEALGYYSDPESREEVRRLALSSEPSALRIAAVRAVGRGSGDLEFLGKVLADPDPQLRVTAGRELKKLDTPEAKARLEEYLKSEKMTWIGPAIRGGGELSQLVRGSKLTLSGSGDAAKSASFPTCSGVWEGVVLHPKAGKAGLHSLPVQISIDTRRGGAYRVLLPVPSQFAVSGTLGVLECTGLSVRLKSPSVWGEAFQVFDRSVVPSRPSKSLPPEWSLQIFEQAGETWLEGRQALTGSRLLLRKSSDSGGR